ncbi:unnamed protein product [Ambrosiozyma monospora]|uniref:Unnamed protein product n=1 Tax=Ambrosiozyma monospora TaxID=43982 RepID=A0A9W6YMH4_AMBMO|nr:unnamed protein product [Ambrosiozyma monospora]
MQGSSEVVKLQDLSELSKNNYIQLTQMLNNKHDYIWTQIQDSPMKSSELGSTKKPDHIIKKLDDNRQTRRQNDKNKYHHQRSSHQRKDEENKYCTLCKIEHDEGQHAYVFNEDNKPTSIK